MERFELEFAEARKDIINLRLENRKLEKALSLMSKVVSDDECDERTVVIALPQGAAMERIDVLLRENSKLASEIVELRQGTDFAPINEELISTKSMLEYVYTAMHTLFLGEPKLR